MTAIAKRIYSSILSAFPKAGNTIWWLLKIIIPISLFVSFLQYYGVIAQIAVVLKPVFTVVGLPGESAVVFISSFFLPLYGPIAIISTLSLSIREITILALMCLISHNLLVETAIQKKTGSSFIIMLSLRLMASLLGAFVLNLLLPANLGTNHFVHKSIEFGSLSDMLLNWVQNSGYLSIKIALIICGLMVLQSILKEFHVLNILSKVFAPLMRVMGLSVESSFLWLVAQTIGLTYGSAVMIEEVNNREISRESANLLNYHIAINHSLLEDTLLFVAIGVPGGWIIAPRFLIAIIVVWGVRGIMNFKKKSKDFSQLSNEAIKIN